MKKTFRSIKALLASGLMLAGMVGNAQNVQYPFASTKVEYSFGYMPQNNKDADAKAAYDSWKAAYVKPITCTGTSMFRVTFDDPGNSTPGIPKADVAVSEGVAYGMLLTAYYGDKTTFDGLWEYYKYHMNTNKVMNWYVNLCNKTAVKANGATDAELDAAWALWVAHNQFGGGVTSQYKADCIALVNAIKISEIDKSGGLNTLKPGDQFGGHSSGNDLVNPSYFSPAYYRVFGEITNDVAFWDKVYETGYNIIDKCVNKTTGLVPDWCTGSTGIAPAPLAVTNGYGGTQGSATFFYDAVRTPVRTALDYLWYGDQAPRALAYSKRFNNWLRGKHANPGTIGARYKLDGTQIDDSHNNTFVGAFAVSTMATDDANTRTYTNSIYSENVRVTPGSSEYFNSSWKVLSLFMLSGHFYLPPPDLCDGPFLQPEYHLCQGTPQSIDCGVTAQKYEWKFNGAVISGATGQTYNATKAGNYEVSTTITVAGNPCVRRAATIVYDAAPKASFTFKRNGTAVDFTNTSTGGELFSESPSLTSAWAFGSGSTPASSTTANGATNYGSGGLKLVTLTVKNICGNTSSYTEQVTLPTGSGQGWFMTDFANPSSDNNTVGQLAAYVGSAKNPNISLDSACQFATVKIKKTMGQSDAVALTFKSDSSTALYKRWTRDISGYPYVRFRVKFDGAVAIDSIRVDISSWNSTTDKFTYNGAVVKDRVYLKGPRKADGSYEKIVNNEWFVSTLSFEGKMSGIDPTKVTQLAFIPYSQYPTANGRQDFTMYIDWATVGNKDIPKPAPTAGTYQICEGSAAGQLITGADLDSCNAEKAVWDDDVTGFKRTLQPGTYTVKVSNFAGDSTKTIIVNSVKKVNLSFGYEFTGTPTTGTTSTIAVKPIDASSGSAAIASWDWYRANSASPASLASSCANATSTNCRVATNQSPATVANRFLAAGGDYLCLVLKAKPALAACTTSALQKCILLPAYVASSIEETLTEGTFAIFPTVVTDNRLNVQLGTGLQGVYEVQVINVNGAQVATSKAISGNNEIILDSNLPAGTYIAKVSQGDKTITKRFIKQ